MVAAYYQKHIGVGLRNDPVAGHQGICAGLDRVLCGLAGACSSAVCCGQVLSTAGCDEGVSQHLLVAGHRTQDGRLHPG